jgi:predicted nucleic acid-binding protein
MQKRPAVIDTSCVIALDGLDAVPRLAFLFSRLWVPKAVRGELCRRRRMKDRLKAYFDAYAFVQPCDKYDQGAVDVLLTERVRRGGKKDRGEAEAVVQAATLAAMAVIDEPWGRRLAKRYSLECHGTIWILEQLHALGLKAAHEIRGDLQNLRTRHIRFPLRAANDLLIRIGEQPIRTESF